MPIETGDELLGRYQVINEIGRGGMGQVLRAQDLVLGRTVAIKVLPSKSDEAATQRFAREARSAAALSHPGIVSIYDVAESAGSRFIVMEYVEGRTLDKHLASVAPTEWPKFLSVLNACADALDYAHSIGVVHRDIKPSNIIIREDGSAKILDFGIARIQSESTSITQTGEKLGTPTYMAPEQITGRPTTPSTDQYALAVIAYTVLTGRVPFGASDVYGLIFEIIQTEAPRPSSLNPALSAKVDRIFMRALAKDPVHRFGSCGAFMDALQSTLSSRAQLPGSIQTTGRAIPPLLTVPAATRSTLFGAVGAFISTVLDHFSGSKPDTPAAPVPTPIPPVVSAPPPQPVPQPPAGTPGPGEFTQMFNRADQTVLLRGQSQGAVEVESLDRARARELLQLLNQRDFESAVALRGKWLPGIEGANGELLGFSEAARYLAAAQQTTSPHLRAEQLKRAEQVLITIGNQLLRQTYTAATDHYSETLDAWKKYAREEFAAAQQKAANELPNPFRAGQPLRPDQGAAVFRGRSLLVRHIEAILADAGQSSSLALLGPRRCGKTSLLQMLPVMLPECACVFFDLQDNPVSSVPQFFEALVRRAREQVRAQRRIELPGLDSEATFESATRWLDQLESMTELNRFLICLDEFERLETLFPGDRSDLLRLMGLFRATIQHRRKVRLLVSGVAPFEELGSLWNDHFINLRELRIGHLDEQTSIDLLTRPVPEFPSGAVPVDVAREIYERTAGQPFLIQLFGSILISRLNLLERSHAVAADIPEVEAEALMQGRYYFSNIYEDAPNDVREALESLASGRSPALSGKTRRWLQRRWLIDDDGLLRTPVVGAFIREELGV